MKNRPIKIIITLTVVITALLIGAVFNWKKMAVSVRGTSKDEREKTEVQTDDNKSKNSVIKDNGKDALSGNIDSGVNKFNTTDEIVIDSISDAKLVIDRNEENSIKFESGTIEQFNGSIKDEEQVDSYDFVPDIDGIYRFEFSNIPNSVSHNLYLYNADGEELYRKTSCGNENGITAQLNGGQKYVAAVGQSWNTGSYTLNIGHQKPEQVISEYSQIADAIQFTDQENDYVFVPERDGIYRFEFSEIPNNVFHSIYVYNANREELDRRTTITNGNGITISLEAGQKYYIVVRQSVGVGSYKLLIGKQKPAVDISDYTIISDAIQYTDQKNIYDFIPKNDGLYRFEFANMPNGILNSLFVYNSGYEEIACHTCIFSGGGISINLNANETYHIAVKQESGVGSYNLLVGCQKEIVDISKCTSVTDSIQFTEQRNVYSFVADESRDITFTFSDISGQANMNLRIYNSYYEELNYKTGMGNDSELTIPVNDGSSYYIVVEQNWKYGSYKLNIQ